MIQTAAEVACTGSGRVAAMISTVCGGVLHQLQIQNKVRQSPQQPRLVLFLGQVWGKSGAFLGQKIFTEDTCFSHCLYCIWGKSGASLGQRFLTNAPDFFSVDTCISCCLGHLGQVFFTLYRKILFARYISNFSEIYHITNFFFFHPDLKTIAPIAPDIRKSTNLRKKSLGQMLGHLGHLGQTQIFGKSERKCAKGLTSERKCAIMIMGGFFRILPFRPIVDDSAPDVATTPEQIAEREVKKMHLTRYSLQEDLNNRRCYLVEYTTGGATLWSTQPAVLVIQHEITREQYAALRERTNRRPAEQTNSAPVELVKILSEIGIIPTGNKKAAAAPDQENSDDL